MRGTGRILMLGGMLLLLPACGAKPGTVPVFPAKGRVFYQGRPTDGAIVQLHPRSPLPPGTPLPRGRVEADGSFRLTTHVTNDGAPAGEYDVTITWRHPTEYAEQEGPDRIPARYGDPKLSGLSVRIEPQSNDLPEFRLAGKS
ncbi:MAG: hypothetical protein U0840_20025 [Gemmataceae bacterium]